MQSEMDLHVIAKLRAHVEELEEKLSWRNRDIEAYRGALGYSVPEGFSGYLTDGTMPKNCICESVCLQRDEARAERDRYRAALEVIGADGAKISQGWAYEYYKVARKALLGDA